MHSPRSYDGLQLRAEKGPRCFSAQPFCSLRTAVNRELNIRRLLLWMSVGLMTWSNVKKNVEFNVPQVREFGMTTAISAEMLRFICLNEAFTAGEMNRRNTWHEQQTVEPSRQKPSGKIKLLWWVQLRPIITYLDPWHNQAKCNEFSICYDVCDIYPIQALYTFVGRCVASRYAWL
jgi:hypothetical protein